MHQDSQAPSLEHVFGVLRRRLPLIVLCVVISAGIAFGLAKRETKKYTATAALQFSYDSLSQQIAGLQIAGASSALVAQQASNVELVKLGDMAAKTAAALGHGLSAQKVAGSISVEGQGESSVVTVSATATSPVLAAAITNTYTREFVREQQSANHTYFSSALAIVDKQLARLSPAQRIGPDGVALQNRAQTLRLLAELHYGNVQIGQEAAVPSGPSSPKTSRNTALGLFVGLILGLALAFGLDKLDRRIRRPADLVEIYRLPLLGAVPKSAALGAKGNRTELPPQETEAFGRIRAHLRAFNVDRDLHTLAIASAVPGEGKSMIARHLAETAARFGSRVLLLEADLRQPTLAGDLGVDPSPGLAEVLAGRIALEDAIQSVQLKSSSDQHGLAGALDVLSAGAPTANPAGMLESEAMRSGLRQARFLYDLVVIDTPPLTAVSDALQLLTHLDGTILVGRIGRSRRDVSQQVGQVLASSGVPLLGVIANGAKPDAAYGYAVPGYGRHSAEEPSATGEPPAGEVTRQPLSLTPEPRP